MFSFLINPLFIFWFPVFVCLSIFVSFVSCSFAFVRLNKNQPYILLDVFFIIPGAFWGFPVFVSKALCCFLFSSFDVFFFVTSFIVLLLQKCKLKSPHFGQDGGCNIRFFYSPVFCNMSQVIVFSSFFAQFLVGVHQPKKHRKHLFPPPPQKKRTKKDFA